MTLAQSLAAAVMECLNHGMRLPLTATAVSENGSVLVIRYQPNSDGTMAGLPLASHTQGRGFALPISVMILDPAGQSSTMVITQTRATFH
jgi:hypothetical protein